MQKSHQTQNRDQKRFIISFNSDQVDMEMASSILGCQLEELEDGVISFGSEDPLNESKIQHFEELGISIATLSEKEVESLRANENVAAVEEDIEVQIVDDLQKDNGSALAQEDTFDSFLESEFLDIEEIDRDFDESDEDEFEKELLALEKSSDLPVDLKQDTNPSPILLPGLKGYHAIYPDLFSSDKATQDATEESQALQSIPWNIRRIRAHYAWRRARYGFGVKIAVLDTGIAPHQDLRISGGASFVPGQGSFVDEHGHGTHCAGIIGARNNSIGVVGVAPLARIYAVKVLSKSGSGRLSWVIAGLIWSLRNRMQVVSMSLGSASPVNTAYSRIIRRLHRSGIVVVAAAGNSFGSSFPFVNAPANSPGVIAVGAVDSRSRIGNFSSRGGNANQVTVVAPGVNIVSTFLNNTYRSLTGTSMACPHVAGTVALILRRHPYLSVSSIKRMIMYYARDLGRRGWDSTYGSGLVDAYRTVR